MCESADCGCWVGGGEEGGDSPFKNITATFCCSFIIGCAALVCVRACVHPGACLCACCRKQRFLMDGGSQRGGGGGGKSIEAQKSPPTSGWPIRDCTARNRDALFDVQLQEEKKKTQGKKNKKTEHD